MINFLFNFFPENDIKRKGFSSLMFSARSLFLMGGRNKPARMELSVTQCEGMLLKLYPA